MLDCAWQYKNETSYSCCSICFVKYSASSPAIMALLSLYSFTFFRMFSSTFLWIEMDSLEFALWVTIYWSPTSAIMIGAWWI